MTDDVIQRWSQKCPFSHKNIFATRNEALAFAEGVREEFGGGKSKAYPCIHCLGWHISTERPDNARERKKRRR